MNLLYVWVKNVEYLLDLFDWVRKHGLSASHFLATGETFLDSHGVRRYLHNWQPVYHSNDEDDFTEGTIRFLAHQTGCKKVIVSCEQPITPTASTADQSSRSDKISRTVYHPAIFLQDWERLWAFLEMDNEDEIAIQAPLLRAYVEFFFHQKTCWLMISLYLYNLLVFLILEASVAPPWGTKLEFLYEHVLLAIQLLVYLALMLLFKGYIFYPPPQHSSWEEEDPEEGIRHDIDSQKHPDPSSLSSKKKSPSGKIIFHSVQWTRTFVQLINRVRIEIKELCITKPPHLGQRQFQPLRKRVSYYTLMNIALKFLTRYNGIDPQKINFNRRSYRLVLLFIVTGLPIYQLVNTYLYPYLSKVRNSCTDDFEGSYCQYYLLECLMTGGMMTLIVMQYIYGASVFLSLAGLAYGGEITHRLANSWMENELKDHLLHDATEHYLFIREVMAACGHIWSVGLTGLFALAIYIIVAYSTFSVYFYKLDSGVTIWQLIIVMIVRTLLLIIYPIASVCHANTYIYELQETFSMAAPDDFSVLGGRDRWVALLQQSPAVWTYYGLWITYDRLLGLAWTMIAALAAYVFSVLFRS
eukprot:gene2705-2955_t